MAGLSEGESEGASGGRVRWDGCRGPGSAGIIVTRNAEISGA
jgi:hypothetical protein